MHVRQAGYVSRCGVLYGGGGDMGLHHQVRHGVTSFTLSVVSGRFTKP